MTAAYINARRPQDIALEVERLRKEGCRAFVLRRLGGDEMLDRERLGAARYAAGLQAVVELERDSSPVASRVPAAAAR